MTRRVTSHGKVNLDEEHLLIVTVWEEGINKEELKKRNIFSKQHGVLIKSGHFYDYKCKNA